jgi:hypothetical protein
VWYVSLAIPLPVPVPQNVSIGDDKLNWEALWNATKDDPPLSRSGEESVFDMIVRLNAQARGRITFTLLLY